MQLNKANINTIPIKKYHYIRDCSFAVASFIKMRPFQSATYSYFIKKRAEILMNEFYLYLNRKIQPLRCKAIALLEVFSKGWMYIANLHVSKRCPLSFESYSYTTNNLLVLGACLGVIRNSVSSSESFVLASFCFLHSPVWLLVNFFPYYL